MSGGRSSEPQPGFEDEALPHLDAVYRFALRLAGTPDQADDLVQETFLRAYRSWDQYTRGTRAKSWLFTICRNVFLRGRERAQRHSEIMTETTSRPADDSPPASPTWMAVHRVDPEGDFFDSIVDEQVLAAIDDLPEEYRMAVVLSDFEGLPYAEVAELLDVPVGTVKSRLFRGRRQLQKVLYEYAVEMGYVAPRAAAGEER